MISREEDNKLTMICYLGTFNWNMEELKKQTYEEVEKHYLSMNPPKGLLNQPITLDKDIEGALEFIIDLIPNKDRYNSYVVDKLNSIKEHITAQASEIESLGEMYTTGVKVNEQLQSKLTAIEEIMKLSKYEFDTNSWKIYDKIKQLIGGTNEK